MNLTKELCNIINITDLICSASIFAAASPVKLISVVQVYSTHGYFRDNFGEQTTLVVEHGFQIMQPPSAQNRKLVWSTACLLPSLKVKVQRSVEGVCVYVTSSRCVYI